MSKKQTGWLEEKGLSVYLTDNTENFIEHLSTNNPEIIWLIPSSVTKSDQTKLCEAIKKSYKKGVILFIWGDNEPFFVESKILIKTQENLILIILFVQDFPNYMRGKLFAIPYQVF